MTGTGIMTDMETRTGRICTPPYPSEKVKDFSYLYPCSINVKISGQNRNRFGLNYN